MGDADGNAKGGFILLDGDTFEVGGCAVHVHHTKLCFSFQGWQTLGSFLLLPLTKQLAVSGSCVRMCSLTLAVHAVGCCRSRMTSGLSKPLNSATTSGELIARHVETKTACLRFSPGRQPAGQPPARPLTQLASSWTWLQHDYCCRCASAAGISTLQGL